MSGGGAFPGGAGATPPDYMALFRERYLPAHAAAMEECERRLAGLASRPGGLLGRSCVETLAAGGKRLRPLLVFLSAKAGSPPDESLYAAAVAVELVHMATLVHDDVLDQAQLRRGRPTLYARHGAGVSAAAGDYLFATAFGVLAAGGSRPAARELAGASLGLSRGELAQMRQAFDYGLSADEYFGRCRLKTSGLFTAACRLGAVLSGAGDAAVQAMGEYGDCLGLAFQIADDILDYSGDPGRSGKLTGTDLRDGTVTLPLIIALGRDASLAALVEGEMTAELVDQVRERVAAAGALEESHRTAYGYVERARSALGAAAGEIDTGPLELIAAAAADRKA